MHPFRGQRASKGGHGVADSLQRRSALAQEDYVEDYLMIERVEPGALWFEGRDRAVQVPKGASDVAEPGWSVNIVLGRAGDKWHLLEVGNVYP